MQLIENWKGTGTVSTKIPYEREVTSWRDKVLGKAR